MTRSANAALRSSLVILLTFLLKTSAYAAPKPGDRFGDWAYECNTAAGNQSVCTLGQTVVAKKDQHRLIQLNILNPGKAGQPILRVLVPLGIHLPSEVTAAVGLEKPFLLTVQACTKQGCIATARLTDQILAAMKSGGKLAIRFSVRPGKPVVINGSLKGIVEGLKAINL